MNSSSHLTQADEIMLRAQVRYEKQAKKYNLICDICLFTILLLAISGTIIILNLIITEPEPSFTEKKDLICSASIKGLPNYEHVCINNSLSLRFHSPEGARIIPITISQDNAPAKCFCHNGILILGHLILMDSNNSK